MRKEDRERVKEFQEYMFPDSYGRGRAQGRAEGRAEGLEEGEERGRREAYDHVLRSLFTSMFGELDASFLAALDRCDEDRLVEMFNAAAALNSFKEVRALMAAARSRRTGAV